jgi:RNA polymerase sigma-70 factor (ECF subfamily)
MDSKQRQFEALVGAYAADLYRYAFWLCRQHELAEDLVQETFMRAWKSLASLQDYTVAKSWLITILRRENARHHERRQLDVTSLDDDVMERIASETADPTDLILLRQAMANLALEYREPLLLQVIGGFSCDEIAAELGIKPGAVMTRLFRARQKLHASFENNETIKSSKG